MSTTGDLPGLPGNEPDGDDDAVFDELARRAGAALRRPAPADGVHVIAARRRRQQAVKATVAGGAVAAVLIGTLMVASSRADPDGLPVVEFDTGNAPSDHDPSASDDRVASGDNDAAAEVETTVTADQVDQPTTTSVLPVWSGPVRDGSGLVHPMATGEGGRSTWQDPLDAAVGWVDVERVAFSPEVQARWDIELAAKPPRAADREPGLLIAYGLVLETTGDEVADYLVGMNTDTPKPGDYHVWVTDLATGETDEQIGPPYGFPVEFGHPDDRQPPELPPGPPTVWFTFLPPSAPADLDPETVRFYAWTSTTRDGEVVAWDYAPDTGWISPDAP